MSTTHDDLAAAPVTAATTPASRARSTVEAGVTRSLFDGPWDLEDDHKDDRLKRQLVRVYEVMRSGEWLTLRQIAERAKAPEASVSARLRDLRKPRFGGFAIVQEWTPDRGHVYRLVPLSGEVACVYDPQPDPEASERAEARERLAGQVRAADLYERTHVTVRVIDLRRVLR